ncbi:MAG: ion transporter [Rhodospirillaceae bacterium]|jgi:voltage-gated sodium channel|nr:ion transporter [Rhodospirillaceae bacterium]MBT4587880.1 ion transporter [Rhodospirillaceae bacterium]MBT5940775.1 ion transporter [Rhodospirillaceae bacterium]MBT7266627.1 ion transporter [Rhodospirillaceae bacterium]
MIAKIGDFVEGSKFQGAITVLIVLNAAALGFETNPDVMAKIGPELILFDHFVLAVFTIEIAIKLIYRRLDFFKNGWNNFDFIIVGIALIPSSGPLAVLRTLRIFRAMRLLSVVPSMRKVVQALFLAIPGILSVGSIIMLIFYVSSVLTTNFFGARFDEWFGSVGRSMYSLFQIMTLESWSMGIVRPVMEVFPWAWIFFVIFILITSFAVLNLFIGIIVDAMQQQSYEEQQAIHEDTGQVLAESTEIHQEVIALRQELRELKDLLAPQN